MSQQQRRLPLPLIGLFILGLLIGLYLVTGKRSGKDDSENTIARHRVDTSSDDALKYWTAKKMHNAKPAEMPKVNKLSPEKKSPKGSPDTSQQQES